MESVSKREVRRIKSNASDQNSIASSSVDDKPGSASGDPDRQSSQSPTARPKAEGKHVADGAESESMEPTASDEESESTAERPPPAAATMRGTGRRGRPPKHSGPSRASERLRSDTRRSYREMLRGEADENAALQKAAAAASATTSKRSVSEERKNSTEKSPAADLRDAFCWTCHRETGRLLSCDKCPRVYHPRCLPDRPLETPASWTCPECERIASSESSGGRSASALQLGDENFKRALGAIVSSLRANALKVFLSEVDGTEVAEYYDYIRVPFDLSTLQRNLDNGRYHSTESFLADLKWILHNSLIFNGRSSQITSNARVLINICKGELVDLDRCPDCYSNSISGDTDWFCAPCRTPHTLVWARVKGYPPWPAKVLSLAESGGERLANVRFFGESHDRAALPLPHCLLLSREVPVPVRLRSAAFEDAIRELKTHIARLRDRFGYFEYAPSNVPFDERGAQYFRDVLTDESKRRSFSSRLSHLINPPADAANHSECAAVEASVSRSSAREDEQPSRDVDEDEGDDQNKSAEGAAAATAAAESGTVREPPTSATSTSTSTTTSELRANAGPGTPGASASGAQSERVSSDQQVLQMSQVKPESDSALPPPPPAASGEPSIADRLLEKLANSAMSAEERNATPASGLRLSLRIPSGAAAAAAAASTPASAGHSGRGGRHSLLNKLTAKKMLSARDISRISAAGGETSVTRTAAAASVSAAAAASASTCASDPQALASPSATSPSGAACGAARKQRKIAPKRLPEQSEATTASTTTANGNVFQRQLSKTIDSCQSNLLLSSASPPKHVRPLVPRPRDQLQTAAASASSADTNDSCTGALLKCNPNSSNGVGALQASAGLKSNASSASVAVPPRKRHLLLSNATAADEPASRAPSAALDVAVAAAATSDPSGAPSCSGSGTVTTLLDPSVSGFGAPSPKRLARSLIGDPHSAFAFASAQSTPALLPSSGISDGTQNQMKSLVEMWLRNTFERAIDSFPFDTFIGALAANTCAPGERSLASAAMSSSAGAMGAADPSLQVSSSGRPLPVAFAASGNSALNKRVSELEEELNSFKWLHDRAIQELQHVHELSANEREAAAELERSRVLQELRKRMENERLREIDVAKRKQWCAACGREAQYFCCWNTSYCDLQCQRTHWPTHMTRCGQVRPQNSQVAAGVPPSGNRMPVTSLRPVAPNAAPAAASPNMPPPYSNSPASVQQQQYSISGTFLPNPTLSHSRPPAPTAPVARNDSPPHLVDLSSVNPVSRGPHGGHQSGSYRPQAVPAAHNNGRSDLSVTNSLRQPALPNSQQRSLLNQPTSMSGRSPTALSRGMARYESQNRYSDGSTALQTPIPHPQTLLPSSPSFNNSTFR